MKIKKIIFVLGTCLLTVVSQAQLITTYVGNGIIGCSGYGGPAVSAKIKDPLGCTFDNIGNFYFCNQQCHIVCKVDTSGILTIVAGNGLQGFSGDGAPATSAKLNYPNDVIVDRTGNIFIADGANNRIRKVDGATHLITTIAGSGIIGYGGDGGPATAALFNGLNGICVDEHGNVFVSDANNHRIRKLDTAGIISTYAGIGTSGFSGDGGPATAAQLFTPFDLVIDRIGNLLFPDANNRRLRKIDTFGIISTIAGTGLPGYNGDSIAATAADFHPYKVALDTFGNIYLADSNRIRKIDAGGIIYTVAGTSTSGYNGDSILATSALISSPSGIVADRCGNIYFGDVGNNRIRKVTFDTSCNITDPLRASANEMSGQAIVVYPNPVVSCLSISSRGVVAHVSISNLIGDVLYDKPYNQSQIKLDVGFLPAGNYLLRITDMQMNVTIKKIIKQ